MTDPAQKTKVKGYADKIQAQVDKLKATHKNTSNLPLALALTLTLSRVRALAPTLTLTLNLTLARSRARRRGVRPPKPTLSRRVTSTSTQALL